MWLQNIGWDNVIDDELKSLWLTIRENLPFIKNIEVPRFVHTSLKVLGEIHGFADASQRAYGLLHSRFGKR